MEHTAHPADRPEATRFIALLNGGRVHKNCLANLNLSEWLGIR